MMPGQEANGDIYGRLFDLLDNNGMLRVLELSMFYCILYRC